MRAFACARPARRISPGMTDTTDVRTSYLWKLFLWSGLLLIAVSALLTEAAHHGWTSRIIGVLLAVIILIGFQLRFTIVQMRSVRYERKLRLVKDVKHAEKAIIKDLEHSPGE